MTGWRIAWLFGVSIVVGCAERQQVNPESVQLPYSFTSCAVGIAGKRVRESPEMSLELVAGFADAECHSHIDSLIAGLGLTYTDRVWVTASLNRRAELQSRKIALDAKLNALRGARPSAPLAAGPTNAGAISREPASQSRRGASTSSTPMKKDRGTYVVPVVINNTITLDFTVDSGASDVTIPLDVVKALIDAGTIREPDLIGKKTYVIADGSKVKSITFRIRSLKVGDKSVENVIGSVGPAKGPLLLGQSFLGRFKSWSIDNRQHALVLE